MCLRQDRNRKCGVTIWNFASWPLASGRLIRPTVHVVRGFCAGSHFLTLFPIATTFVAVGCAFRYSCLCLTASRRSLSEVMLYLSNMDRVLWPLIFMATVSR